MLVTLDKKDLVHLVTGIAPNYSVFENELVKGYGYYFPNDRISDRSGDKWTWNTASLMHLDEAELWELYLLCKDSWY